MESLDLLMVGLDVSIIGHTWEILGSMRLSFKSWFQSAPSFSPPY